MMQLANQCGFGCERAGASSDAPEFWWFTSLESLLKVAFSENFLRLDCTFKQSDRQVNRIYCN